MELDLKSRTPAAANARAEAIRLNVQQAARIYAKAVALEDWRTLHRDNLATWARDEFGPDRFSPERRKEIVALLTDEGLTQRQIAAATGASQDTVKRDQADSERSRSQARTQPNKTPAAPTPRQRAARQREATKRARPAATPPPLPSVPPKRKRQSPKPPGPRRRFCLEGDRLDDPGYIANRLLEEVDETVLNEVIVLLGGSVQPARKLRSV